MEPPGDIIKATHGSLVGSIYDGSCSMILELPFHLVEIEDSPTTLSHSSFQLTVECPWKESFNNLTPSEAPDVLIKVAGQEIKTTQAILSGKSRVFADTLAADTTAKEDQRVVKIEGFSYEAVSEMIRYLMHGYCARWVTHYEELAALADMYDIKGLQDLAREKKELLDQRTDNSCDRTKTG